MKLLALREYALLARNVDLWLRVAQGPPDLTNWKAIVVDSDRCERGLCVRSGCSRPPRREHRDSQDSDEHLCRAQGFPARIQSADDGASSSCQLGIRLLFHTCHLQVGGTMRLGVAGSGSNDMSHPLKILPGHRGGGQAPRWVRQVWRFLGAYGGNRSGKGQIDYPIPGTRQTPQI